MQFARRQMNATILADGQVLVTGGTSGPGFNDVTSPVYNAELWNPATESWSIMARESVVRTYHSTAVLLPDAETREYVQRAAGYSCTGSQAEEVLFLIRGRTAAGKTTLQEALKHALGDYALAADFETFTVRKQSFGVGVERTFPVHSPKIEKIDVIAIGDVSRAKLYFLRDKVGKQARIREKQR